MTPTPSEPLGRLLPAGTVVMRCTATDGREEELFPEERALLARAVARRRREFAAGRLAARAALRSLGLPDAPLLPGPDRAPLWPAGVTGSIAHAGGLALAAVGRTRDVRALGVDLEPDEPVEEDLWRSILTEREAAALADDPDPGRTVRLVFTAKEALFKCLHPLTGVFLAFGDVEIDVDRPREAWRARVRTEVPAGYPPPSELCGRYARDGGYVISAMHLPVAEPGGK